MFWNGWGPILRLLVLGPLAYIGVILLLRLAGKRTLAKMNAFDFIVTIALGSTLAAALLNRDVSLSEGLAAFAILVGLQAALSFASVRWKALKQYITADPQILVWRGEFLRERMRAERIREDEVLSALRQAGKSDLREAAAVVLETDGSLSIIGAEASSTGDALTPALHPPDAES